MKIYLVIDPHDYTNADVAIFCSLEEAEKEKGELVKEKPYKRHYVKIQEKEIPS